MFGGQGLSFGVLGALECRWDGVPVPLGGPTQERLVVLLVSAAGRPVPMPDLVREVWDERPPATAVHQIRKMIAALRRRIPDGAGVLRTVGSGYQLVTADAQVDAGCFAALVDRARTVRPKEAAELLREALGLWRGPIPAQGTVIEAWAAGLEEQRLTAVEDLLATRLELGAGSELVGEVRQLVGLHPLRERLRGQLMTALYRGGRQVEALQEYERVRSVLAEELGVDPGPELRRLHTDMLRNAPDVSAGHPRRSAPCSLPYDLPDFVGRVAELHELTQDHRDGAHVRIVLIEGMGGSGKTTLAVHAAHRLAERYPDGQLYLDLGGFTAGREPLDVGGSLAVLLRGLAVPVSDIPGDLAARTALWRITTADRRILLLLDNAAGAEQLRPLLPASPGCLVLATSRVRLAAVDGARVLPLGALTEHDSKDLVARVVGRDRADADPEALAALVEQCGRLPLALRIAARRLADRPLWNLGYLADRLSHGPGRLSELASGQRSVAASIGLSYEVMDADARESFRSLGLFPGRDLDARAAAALLGTPVHQAERCLEALLDVNLLEQHVAGRYVFHDLVRDFARSLPSPDGDRDAGAVGRLTDHYLRWAAAAVGVLFPGRCAFDSTPADGPPPVFESGEAASAWLELEQDNATATALKAGEYGLGREAVALFSAIGRNRLTRRPERAAWAGHCESLLAVIRRSDDPGLLCAALSQTAAAYWSVGLTGAGRVLAEEALALAEKEGTPVALAQRLSTLGCFVSTLGDYPQAIWMLTRAVQIFRSCDSAATSVLTLVNLASAQHAIGDHEGSLASAVEALGIYEGLGTHPHMPLALLDIGNAEIALGRWETARDRFAEAYAVVDRTGAEADRPIVMTSLGRIHHLLGDEQQASRWFGRARECLRGPVEPFAAIRMLSMLGAAECDRGRYESALRDHRDAHARAVEVEFRRGVALSLHGMAAAEDGLGRTAEARAHRAEAAGHYAAMGIEQDVGLPLVRC
ncbi:DNA-binding SARP family transcriptional activator [Catenulispora sp. GAS73]